MSESCDQDLVCIEDRVLEIVSALVRETHPERLRTVTLDSRLDRDLGLDSLARVELAVRLSQSLHVRIAESVITKAETPRELLSHLSERQSPGLASDPLLNVGTAVTLPTQAQTLLDVLDWHAQRHSTRLHVCWIDEEEQSRRLSYAELLGRAQRVAAGLVARGLLPRQTVALMLPTGFDYLVSFFGVLIAGGVPVPIYPPARLSQLEEHLKRHSRILNNAQASLLITVAEVKTVALLLRAQVPSILDVVSCAECEMEAISLEYRPRANDLAFLQYTSGSTGDPKGVMLTHANLLANVRAMGEAAAVSSDDIFVSWLPLYHDMGLIGAWLGALYHGFPLVLMSPLAFLAQPGKWLRTISHHRATLSAAPNFAYQLCAQRLADAELEGLDLSSWRLAFNGAEPVNPDTLEAFAKRLAPYGLRREAIAPVYGLAECSVGLAFPPLDRGPKVDVIDAEKFAADRVAEPVPTVQLEHARTLRVVACGRVLAGHMMRIVDEFDTELPDRHVGRLQFCGPSATSGYYRSAEPTMMLLRNGWLESGDFAYLADGDLYLTGRVKDLIIRGGRNVYPYDLEQAVSAIEGIRRGCVAVFPSEDTQRGSEKLVVLAETRVTDHAMSEAIKEQISQAAMDIIGSPPDDIVLAPPHTVLKTSSGKIRRAACRALYESGNLGLAPVPMWRQRIHFALAALRSAASVRMRRLGRLAWGIWAWMVFVGLTGPVYVAVVMSPSSRLSRLAVRFGARLAMLLNGLPVRVSGIDHLPARPHVVLVNHASYLDGIVLSALLPSCPGYAFIVKSELQQNPWARVFLRRLGCVFVERFEAQKSAGDIDRVVESLQAGQSMVVFPEGTFLRASGLKDFRMGAFVAAAQAQVPVVAAGLRGTRTALRDGSWLPQRVALHFDVGPVLAPSGVEWADAARLRDASRREILKLCGEHDLLA